MALDFGSGEVWSCEFPEIRLAQLKRTCRKESRTWTTVRLPQHHRYHARGCPLTSGQTDSHPSHEHQSEQRRSSWMDIRIRWSKLGCPKKLTLRCAVIQLHIQLLFAGHPIFYWVNSLSTERCQWKHDSVGSPKAQNHISHHVSTDTTVQCCKISATNCTRCW